MRTQGLTDRDFTLLGQDLADDAFRLAAAGKVDMPPLIAFVLRCAEAFHDFSDKLSSLHFNRGLARSILIARIKLDPTVREAIRHYCQASDDCEAVEKFVRLLRDVVSDRLRDRYHLEEALEDLAARSSRHRNYYRAVLDELGVTIRPVVVGETYAPERHRQIGSVTAKQGDQCGTIAEVHRPIFDWVDEHGVKQIEEAEVSVFD